MRTLHPFIVDGCPPLADRLKDVAQKQYTQREAELGAGKTVEQYTPAHAASAPDAAMDADDDL